MKIWKLPKEKFYVIILLKKIFTSSKSFCKPFSQLLHYSSMMNILIYWEFVWAFNNNHANNNEGFFFLCCCSCTNGKIASSCQLCDGYCYNGGTCQLDPETNVPVCLWVFYNTVGILWYDFRCAWNLCSIVLHSWGNILNECLMDISDQVFFLIGSCTTELSPSLICYWFHKEEIIHSLASYLFQRFRDLWTWKCL